MSMDVAGLLLNIIIAGLLLATISYCWVLNRRIKILQDSKSELAQLLQYFDESTTRASDSIIALQTASKKIGENIQTRIDKANFMLDDLAFMLEKGNRLANQLEASFAVSRARSRIEDNSEPVVQDNEEIIEPPTVKAAPVLERFTPKQTDNKLGTKEKTAASLEAVLDRVIGRTTVKPIANQNTYPVVEEDAARGRGPNPSKARSKAEQELLEMIRAGIKG